MRHASSHSTKSLQLCNPIASLPPPVYCRTSDGKRIEVSAHPVANTSAAMNDLERHSTEIL